MLKSNTSTSKKPTPGIIISRYKLSGLDVCFRITDTSKPYVAEDLCLEAARECNISMTTFHLFGLAVPPEQSNQLPSVWLPPQKIITCPDDEAVEYVFRIRFRMPDDNIQQLVQFDPHAFEYMYLQFHNDFISDRLKQVASVYQKKGKDKLSQEHCLGLGVIDMVLNAKLNGWSLEQLKSKKNLSDFLPPSSKTHYSTPWEKLRLTTNFNKELEVQFQDCNADSEQDIKLRYVMGIFNLVPQYGTEHFVQPTLDQVVHVNPYHAASPGIYSTSMSRIYTKGPEVTDHFCRIDEILDVVMSENHIYPDLSDTEGQQEQSRWKYKVTINKCSEGFRNFPKVLLFESEELAETFVTLLDGYYRLTVDFYHHLSRIAQSPMMKKLRPLKCHGPVGTDWALHKLEDKGIASGKEKVKSGDYILKQARRIRGGYVLVVYNGSPKPMIILVNENSNGCFTLAYPNQPSFLSMKALLDHYQGDNDVIRLHDRLPIHEKEISKLLLCRQGNRLYTSNIKTHTTKKQAMEIVSQVDIKKQILGEGCFTKVYQGVMDKENAILQVAVKQLKKSEKDHLEDFQLGVQRALFWRHPNIVRTHAIMLAPFSVLQELVECGPLTRFLQQPHHQFPVSDLVLAAQQIAMAMMYLDELGAVHGNICGRNILLSSYRPRLEVKLSDPGVISYYNRLSLNHILNNERLAWIAPELYSGLGRMSSQSDMFAFGTTLWEMFSLGDNPLNDMNSEQKMEFMTSEKVLENPVEFCPNEMYRIMCECWSKEPDQRPKPKDIVRDINELLSINPDDAHYNQLLWGKDSETLTVDSGLQSNNEHPSPEEVSNAANRNTELLKTVEMLNKLIGVAPHRSVVPPGRRQRRNRSLESSSPPTSPSTLSEESLITSHTPLLGVAADRPRQFTGHFNNARSISQSSSTELASPVSNGTSGQSRQTMQTVLSDHDLSPTAAAGHRRPDFSSRPLPERPVSEMSCPIELEYILQRDRLHILQGNLGAGHYGVVQKAKLAPKQSDRNGESKWVAVKSLHPEKCLKHIKEFEAEVKLMTKLDHPNIVKVEGMCPLKSDKNPMYLVMEYVEKGCLQKFIKTLNVGNHDLHQINIAYDIAQGMEYLSSKNIVHRDLAARNVLITKDCRAKISDFGLARALGQDRDYYRCSNPNSLIPALWSAPEGLQFRLFTTKSDVWSFAVTLWELYTFGKSPDGILERKESNDLCAILKEGKRLSKPPRCPEALYQIMKSCWQFEADLRPDFEEICRGVKVIRDKICSAKSESRRQTVS